MLSFIATFAIAFGAILLVELPDKTLVATLVLSTKYRPRPGRPLRRTGRDRTRRVSGPHRCCQSRGRDGQGDPEEGAPAVGAPDRSRSLHRLCDRRDNRCDQRVTAALTSTACPFACAPRSPPCP